jgi:glutathione synthase/RimK-type ligase-like ATP-grasp enzyme
MGICFLTPAPDYYEDWSVPKADYLRLFGDAASFVSWTAIGSLSDADLILPLIAWGYQRDCPAWFALLDRIEAGALPVANPARVLRWNTDKAYLVELAEAGVAIVPTLIRESLNEAALTSAREIFGSAQHVVKPPISGGADGTFLISASDPVPAEVVGRRMLIQPYLPAIAAEGEFSLFYFGGEYSHAITKHPAKGDFRVQEQFGGVERSVDAPQDAKDLAVASLAATDAIHNCGALAYARVDMVRDTDGVFRLMELELIEPSLFFKFARDKGAMFAAAVLKQIALNLDRHCEKRSDGAEGDRRSTNLVADDFK